MHEIDKLRASLELWNQSAVKLVRDNVAQLYESEASYLLNEVHHSSLIEYYERRFNKHILMGNLEEALYYNRKIIYSIEDKILKRYCL